ncbi:uncharacterized protein [Asterias amurensis]|uniref:uncharacterized protein n=1 Tax=Asterias amurensis TaxID=7602 RepID=UPI003AB3547C
MAAEILPITARLHVSQLPFDVTEDRLKARFGKYGRVYEVCVRKGFAFVQLGTEEEADRAILNENGSLFEGRKLWVSLTNKSRFGKSINSDGSYNGGGREKDPYDTMDREMGRYGDRDLTPSRPRERSPLRDRYSDRYLDRYDDPLSDPYERDLRKRDRYYDERLPPSRDRYEDRLLPEDDYRRDIAFRDRERLPERERERERDRLDRDRRDSLERPRRDIPEREKDLRDHYDRRPPLHGRSSEPAPRLASPGPSSAPLPLDDKPIDCEILLLGKHLRDYADLVERRLKGLALNTGLLLISVEASLPQALEDVTRRKVLYAIILTSQNEVHRSVTLNILHGSPQEHRNMPLEDALSLVERNYTNYLQDRSAPAKLPPKSALPVASAHTALAAAPHTLPPLPSEPTQLRTQPPLPSAATPASGQTSPAAMVIPNVELTIPQLINLLADRKQLTIQEMDRVIGHLQAVRRKMAVEQGVETDPVQMQSTQPKQMIDSPVQQAPVDTKHNELSAKILSIIHPGPGGSASTTSAKTAPIMSSMPSAPKIGFNQSPTAPPPPPPRPVAGTPLPFSYGGNLSTMSSAPAASKAPPAATNKNINLDSPNVQKALDNLIQSGPTMLKQLATSSNMTNSINTMSKTQASNNAILDLKNAVSGRKPTGPNKEHIEAQLRAAQTAALQTLQQQQQKQQQNTQQNTQQNQQPNQQPNLQPNLQLNLQPNPQMQQQAVLAVQAHIAQQAQQKQTPQNPAQSPQQMLQQQQLYAQQYAQQQAQYAQYQQQQAQYLQQQAQYQQQQGQPQQQHPQMQGQGMGPQAMGSQPNVGQTMPSANMGAGAAGGNAMMQGGAGWPNQSMSQQQKQSTSYQQNQNQAKGGNSKPQQSYRWQNQPGPPGT